MISQSTINSLSNSYIYSNNNNIYLDNNRLINETIDKIENTIQEIKNENINLSKINSRFTNLRYQIGKIFNYLSENSKLQKDQYLEYFVEELYRYIEGYLSEIQKYYCSRKKIYIDNFKLKNGFYFDEISNDAVNEVLNLCSENLKKFKKNIEKGLTKREELSISSGWKIRKVINILNKEFNKKNINEQVSYYMQKNYCVTRCSLELSTPNSKWWENVENSKVSKHTNYAHVDESFVYPKSILYLTDVSKNNGPTSFYPKIYKSLSLNFLQDTIGKVIGNIGSDKKSKLKNYYKKKYHQPMSCEKFLKHYTFLPKKLRFNSHIGWDILNDSALEKEMINDEKFFIGKKGSCVIFDGSKILHRGGLINNGERIVLQIVFGPKINFLKKIYNKIIRKSIAL
jgi:hypothetical protein